MTAPDAEEKTQDVEATNVEPIADEETPVRSVRPEAPPAAEADTAEVATPRGPTTTPPASAEAPLSDTLEVAVPGPMSDTLDAPAVTPVEETADPPTTETEATSSQRETSIGGEPTTENEPVSQPKEEPSPPSYAPSAPVVTTIKPRRIDSRGGTPVTMFGAGFVPGCRAFVAEEELIAEVIDTFTIRFVAPAMSGVLDVTVESPSGKRSQAVQVEFVEGPTITRITPSEGPTEGGIEVTVEGRGFVDGCTVSLFGLHAPDVKFESSERLRFLLPPAADGPLDGVVAVTLHDGLMGRAEDMFRYRPLLPEIHQVEPNRGWISGGKLVALKGKDFHPKAAVRIGAKFGTVQFRSATHVDVEVPAADALGAVDVVLENPDKRAAKLDKAFTYEPVPAPPKIIDVFPKSGLTTGGLTIRIVGDNFTEGVRVRIGELTAMRRVLSSKLIDADVPASPRPGAVAVEVALDDLRIRAEEAFTYISPRAPKISSVEPRSGPTGGGTKVVLEGENFMKGATVRFGGEASKSVLVKNEGRIETVTPASRSGGLVDIEVSSPETGPGVAPKAFRYEAMLAPVVTLVSPNRGTTNGGTELSVEGKNFADGCKVLIDGKPAKTKKISGSVLEAYTPEGDDGKLVDVAVQNPDGQTGFQKRAFQYDARYRA